MSTRLPENAGQDGPEGQERLWRSGWIVASSDTMTSSSEDDLAHDIDGRLTMELKGL